MVDSSNDLIVGVSASVEQANALALYEFYRFIEESNIAMMMEDEE